MKIKRNPYWVNITQVTREVFENDIYTGTEDDMLNVTYSFGSLDEVERFLQDLGCDLTDIKRVADVDFL
jgi:hypothetical protein